MNIAENLNSHRVVIDFGSSGIKGGVALNDFETKKYPSVIIDSIIGKPKYNKIISSKKETKIVSPSMEIRGLYELYKPIQRGVIRSEEDAKLFLNRVYSELSELNINECPVLLAEPSLNSTNKKRMMTDLLFNDFSVPFVFFGTASVLSLYAYGKTDGILMESGDGLTQISTVLNGYKVDHGTEKVNFGGSDVTDFLKILLRKSGLYLNSSSEDSILNEMKKNICQVSTNIGQKINFLQRINTNNAIKNAKTDETCYILPDGKPIAVGTERFLAPELLFNPSLAGFNHPGLPELLESVICKIDSDLTRSLSNTIYFSGGNTQITGFVDRFAKEMSALVGEKTSRYLIVPNMNRAFLAWQGGAIVSQMNSFSKLWISRKDIEEFGDRIFMIKSF